MNKFVIVTLLLAIPVYAGTFSVVNIAAATTIAVNALTIKATLQHARTAAKAAKKAAVKVVKKVEGK
jgi:hypothetical protein